MTHPMAVTNCNIDMEALISDHNRSIATLAITTLLKTGNESSVERLIKQVCAIRCTAGLIRTCSQSSQYQVSSTLQNLVPTATA